MNYMRFAVIPILLVFAGCATTANIQPEEVRLDAADGQFVPVKVFFNRTVPVPNFYVSRLDALEAALKESGAFFDVGPFVDSPFILDITLNRGSNDGVVNFTGQLLSAATLFLLPTKANNFNELTVSVYSFGSLVKTYELREDYSETLSIYNYNELLSNDSNEFRSIKNLVNQFINTLDADNLIPKVKLSIADDVEASPLDEAPDETPQPIRL